MAGAWPLFGGAWVAAVGQLTVSETVFVMIFQNYVNVTAIQFSLIF